MQVSGFGYKNVWFAARGVTPEQLAQALGLAVVGPCEWSEGVEAAYAFRTEQAFITPPVDGWTLCAGTGLFDLADESTSLDTLAGLARRLGTEVQLFGTHRVVEAHSWARATPDGIQRAYMWVGDQGRTAFNVGEPSPEEEQLGFRFFDEASPEAENDGYWEREDLTSPDESHVMQLAGLWSIDPTTLEGRELELTTGLLCRNTRPSAAHAGPRTEETPKKWWQFWK